MTTERAKPDPTPVGGDAPAIWGRPLAIATAAVFLISSAFPVTAGLSKNTESFPKWWGVLDMGIAFILALLAIIILALAQGRVTKQAEDASYRAYRILTHGIFAMMVAFFLLGDRIVWANCLTGFAWRTWLLLYTLPAWFTALSMTTDLRGPRRIPSKDLVGRGAA
jgi:hypothetical protein